GHQGLRTIRVDECRRHYTQSITGINASCARQHIFAEVAHGVELAAVSDIAGRTVAGYDWSEGCATAGMRALILIQCEAPLHVSPGPVPHALSYLLDIESGLIGIRYEA